LERSLRSLTEQLRGLGAALLTVPGDPVVQLPVLAARYQADEVVWNRLYDPFGRRLDTEVVRELARIGVRTHAFPGALLFEPEDYLARSGKPYAQFTAFWKACLAGPPPAEPVTGPSRLIAAALPVSPVDEDSAGLLTPVPDGGEGRGREIEQTREQEVGGRLDAARVYRSRVLPVPTVRSGLGWQPGEIGAWQRLESFLAESLIGYERGRDLPGEEAVSRLSPHLHFGEISPRQVWTAVQQAATDDRAKTQATAFLRQLGWREFAYYLLWHFPYLPHEPFRPEFRGFPWAEDRVALSAWQRGETGFSLVDAGMRQLAAEGWMHNRVRMVVASFLTKDLLIPWQEGAKWFWDNLIDADLANNTLGWQWTAGCGPDAVPYFRIYNPELQRVRFDREGVYVRRWLGAEAFLGSGPGGGLHERGVAPIVDHATARVRALAAFRGLRRPVSACEQRRHSV